MTARTASPVPSATDTGTVPAPGRWRLASARRKATRARSAGESRQTGQSLADKTEQHKNGKDGATKEGSEKTLVAGNDGNRHHARSQENDCQPVAWAQRRAGKPGDTKQTGRRDLPRAKERWQCKDQRDENAAGRGDEKRSRMYVRSDGDGQRFARQSGRKNRKDCSRDQPGGDAESGHDGDLEEIACENQPLRGAQGLQGGDGRHLAGEIGGDGTGHADTSDQEGRQADQGDEEGKALKKPAQRRIGVIGTAYAPGRIRKGLLQVGDGSGHIAGIIEPDTHEMTHETARTGDTRRIQAVQRQDDPRAEAEGSARPIRFVDKNCDDGDRGFPQGERRADVKAGVLEKVPVDDGALRKGMVERNRGINERLAVEWPAVIDGPQVHQQRFAFRRTRHGEEIG